MQLSCRQIGGPNPFAVNSLANTEFAWPLFDFGAGHLSRRLPDALLRYGLRSFSALAQHWLNQLSASTTSTATVITMSSVRNENRSHLGRRMIGSFMVALYFAAGFAGGSE